MPGREALRVVDTICAMSLRTLNKKKVPAARPAGKSADGPRPTEPDHRNLPRLMLQVRERLIDRFRPVLKKHGITEQQYRVLRALYSSGPLEQREIGTDCHISSPSLAGVLGRMDKMGLVERVRLDHDQRRVLVSLPARSADMVDSMLLEVNELYKVLDRDLGVGFAGEVYATLDRMLTLLGPQEDFSDS